MRCIRVRLAHERAPWLSAEGRAACEPRARARRQAAERLAAAEARRADERTAAERAAAAAAADAAGGWQAALAAAHAQLEEARSRPLCRHSGGAGCVAGPCLPGSMRGALAALTLT